MSFRTRGEAVRAVEAEIAVKAVKFESRRAVKPYSRKAVRS